VLVVLGWLSVVLIKNRQFFKKIGLDWAGLGWAGVAIATPCLKQIRPYKGYISTTP
jgi:hypothetical protein